MQHNINATEVQCYCISVDILCFIGFVENFENQLFFWQKIYKKELNGAQYLVENEVEILRRILHKNICHLFGAYESKRSYFLLFEYVERGDRFETLSAVGTLEENLSSKIIAQVWCCIVFVLIILVRTKIFAYFLLLFR